MKVYLPEIGHPHIDSPVQTFRGLAAADRRQRHSLVASPEEADIFLFTQCHLLPDVRLPAIATHPLSVEHPEKVWVYDERDRPWRRFRGLYVSMDRRWFDDRRQRAWAYATAPVSATPEADAEWLVSFVGSPTARCRAPLFRLKASDAYVKEVRGFVFYDPASEQYAERRAQFARITSRSKFVLCPRGAGTSSIRLYETLSRGRVPVIISDHWKAPIGPDWDKCSVRWPEGKTDGLLATLRGLEADWPAMSHSARTAYDEFFAPEVTFHQMVEQLSQLTDLTPKPSLARGVAAAGNAAAAFGHQRYTRGRVIAGRLRRRARRK